MGRELTDVFVIHKLRSLVFMISFTHVYNTYYQNYKLYTFLKPVNKICLLFRVVLSHHIPFLSSDVFLRFRIEMIYICNK